MSKKIFRIAILMLCILALVMLSMFCIGRWRDASPEQQHALTLMAERPAFNEKDNLAPYLWLFLYDIPADKVTDTMASDAEKFNGLTEDSEIPEFRSQAQGNYPEIDYHDAELARYCPPKSESNCFNDIAADLEKLAPVLRESGQALQRAEAITNYRVYYSPMENHLGTPLPGFQMGRRLLQVHYVDLFMGGQQPLAVEKVCGDITAWRSIGANTDSMLAAMIAHAYLRSDLGLLAGMLNKMDSSVALPESCSVALRPVESRENLLCNAVRGEFGIFQNLDVDLGNHSKRNDKISYRLSMALLYDHEQTVRVAAPVYSHACDKAALFAARQYRPPPAGTSQRAKCDAIDWVSNFSGCNMLRIWAPEYGDYFGRKLDQSAQISAMQIFLWLRGQSARGQSPNEAFAARPESLRTFSDRIGLNQKAGVLEVELFSPRSMDSHVWTLPLPLPTQLP